MAEISVRIVTEVDQELADTIARLLPQLSRSADPPDRDQLQRIASHQACDLLVASDPELGVVGSLTLVVFPLPTGIRAWIEDVVVDEAARGRGIGDKLNRFALERARELGAKTVDLTSRPSREAANRLYQRIGFEARETNVYRYGL